MNKIISQNNILSLLLASLVAMIGTGTYSHVLAQPTGEPMTGVPATETTTTNATEMVFIKVEDSRDNAEYYYELPKSLDFADKLKSILKSIYNPIVGAPGTAEATTGDPTLNELLDQQVAEAAQIVGAQESTEFEGLWDIVKKGVKIVQDYGPLAYQIGSAVLG